MGLSRMVGGTAMRMGTRSGLWSGRLAALAAMLAAMLATMLAATLATAGAGPAPDYSKSPARSSPAWVHDGVIYEIFPREFSASGDFAGVTAQLDRLQRLGVTILWLMPVHPMGRLKAKGTVGSPYAVRDYYGIDPALGTAADLHRLVSEAHRRGLKVIIDIVANHTAWDSNLMAHPEYYEHDAEGHIVPPEPTWTDVAHLNYDNAGLRRYMQDMLVHWLRDFDLDGFRCDVAAHVPTGFWEQARDALAKVKPDIVMLAEADSPDLLVKAFDLDYSWSLAAALTDVVQGRRPASALREDWTATAARYPRGALRMRFSDDHDESRAIARYGERAALAASALMFTLDGVPMLYNGMEVGDTTESGAPALFEKLPIFWAIAERRPGFPDFYRKIIALRAAHPALRGGDLRWLHNSDEARVLTFERRDKDETLVVAVNLSAQPFLGVVEAGGAPYSEVSGGNGPAGVPALSLGAWDYRVFKKQQ
jgi:cyclomaltodextrinase / maltogenic alpha-amylase / neopullulanase